MFTKLSFSLLAVIFANIAIAQNAPIDAITYGSDQKDVYVPAKSLADALGMPLSADEKLHTVTIGTASITGPRQLPDGSKVVLVADLEKAGAQVSWNEETHLGTVVLAGKTAQVSVGQKRVVVDLATQHLRAYQGNLLVLETHVSTGRIGKSTPAGNYVTGPKYKMHRSRLYNNAPMPWSVQVNGNIFIHGFTSVPKRPASHGCIRLPIPMAHWFYRWIDQGTPVSIVGQWAPPKQTIESPNKQATKSTKS